MSGIVVMGAAGGCGTTTLACALALHMAPPGGSPLLVDAGMHGAGPAALWGLDPARALDDLLPLGDGVTAGHVDQVVHHHACGVDVIAGSTGPAGAALWHGPRAQAVAAHVAARGEWVADAGQGDAPLAQVLVRQATRLVLVVPATVQGAARAARGLPALEQPAVLVASALPGGDALAARAMRAAMGGRAVVALDRDDRGARDVAEGRLPRGRRMARAVDAVLEQA
ncbi:MAG: hypothetical protein ISP32_03285 [Thermoleophilia bacterium]|nr:hypothetical protein [Thermoleophilia bacterium]